MQYKLEQPFLEKMYVQAYINVGDWSSKRFHLYSPRGETSKHFVNRATLDQSEKRNLKLRSKRFSHVSVHQSHLEVLAEEMAGLHPGGSDSVSLGGTQ